MAPYFHKYYSIRKAQALGVTININDLDKRTLDILYEIDLVAKELDKSKDSENGKRASNIRSSHRKRST